MINEEKLLEYGFVKDKRNPIDLYQKNITWQTNSSELDDLILSVTKISGQWEFCLILCEGQRLFLHPESLDQLKVFEKIIARYEPVW